MCIYQKNTQWNIWVIAMHRKVGRPLKIESKEKLIECINDYLGKTPEEEITITGLCLSLGINKDTFYEYAKREEYADVIEEARLIVENSYEISLRKNGRTGDIFALKNFGWVDKQEIEADVKNDVTINIELTDEE